MYSMHHQLGLQLRNQKNKTKKWHIPFPSRQWCSYLSTLQINQTRQKQRENSCIWVNEVTIFFFRLNPSEFHENPSFSNIAYNKMLFISLFWIIRPNRSERGKELLHLLHVLARWDYKTFSLMVGLCFSRILT